MHMNLKHEDAILKEVSRNNSEGFSQLLGIEDEVKGVYPSDGLHFDPKQFQPDMVYILEDGTLLNIEFQTTFPKKDDMNRFKYYGAGLQFKSKKTTKTLIVYSGLDFSKNRANNLMNFTDFYPKWFLFRQNDADKILSNIKHKIKNNINLNSLDCCNLSLILLFESNRSYYEIIKEASDIVIHAESLSTEQKKHVANVQFILADKFLPGHERDEIKGVFSMKLSIFDEFIEDGIKQGIEQGIEQGKAEEARRIAKDLLDDGVPIEVISRTTHLSVREIENLSECNE